MDELLTIGEFSRACGLSPKVLRTYAADGLLTPAAVDRVSGYRYYAPSQVRAASTIALLRRAGTPLRDIASFLARPAAARLGQLDAWERDLDAELTVRRQALREVRASMTGALPSAGAAGAAGADGADGADLAPESAAPGRGPADGLASRFSASTAFTAASATAAGLGRARNQDAVLLGDALFAVADGMGEHGDVASLLAVEVLDARFAADPTLAGLAAACRAANAAVWRRADQEAEATTGSTVTALAVLGPGGGTLRVDDSQRIQRKIVRHDGGPAGAASSDHGDTAGPPQPGQALAVASIGDSRAYLRRDGVLRRLTQDHSLVAELVRAGALTEDEARTHPQRSLLTRALGTGPDVEPSLARVDHQPGDRLLLCTDGLFGALDSGEIDAALAAADRPGEAADELVRLARDRGQDDVSVIVINASAGPGGEPRA